MKPHVVITERLDDACAAWLGERAEVVWHAFDAPGIDAALADADGLVVRTYTRVDDAWLDRCPKVRVIGRAGVGLDNFDLSACARRGIRVVYTPDANTQAVVEYVTGLMLDRYRPRPVLPEAASADAFHRMRTTAVGTELAGLTLGVIGYGRIGRRITAVAEALGMRVLCCDIDPVDPLDPARRLVDHDTVYAESDIVTLHADGRAANRHMIDASVFAAMKPDAMFINAARGVLVDAEACAAWLERRPDALAVLDVHDPEPPPADLRLWHLPNCRLHAHLASRTETALRNMSWVVRDVWAVLAGHEPNFPAA